MPTLSDLGIDLLTAILDFLPIRSICKVALTSKLMKEHVASLPLACDFCETVLFSGAFDRTDGRSLYPQDCECRVRGCSSCVDRYCEPCHRRREVIREEIEDWDHNYSDDDDASYLYRSDDSDTYRGDDSDPWAAIIYKPASIIENAYDAQHL